MEHATSGISEMMKMPPYLLTAGHGIEQRLKNEKGKIVVRQTAQIEMDQSLIIPTFLFRERHIKPLV